MSIKVASTEIISDSYILQNFNSMDGNYTGLFANANSITTVIDMDTPVMLASLSAATTFTATNVGVGKTAVLLLDVGASGYAPTFPSTFKFAEDTEPSWTGTRYWQIGLTAWDSSTVRVVATGYSGSGASAPTVDLGSTINTYSSGSNLGGYARTTLAIGQAGTIATSGTGTSGATTGTVSRTWLLSGSASDYQIKWDGTGDTSYLISNSGLGTWLNGGVNLSWVLEEDDNDSVIRSVSGTLSIRDTATSTVQDTVSVTISADFSP
jgi:hypothetical protein